MPRALWRRFIVAGRVTKVRKNDGRLGLVASTAVGILPKIHIIALIQNLTALHSRGESQLLSFSVSWEQTYEVGR